MDTEWTKNTFEQDRYVLLRGFFDEDQTREVRVNISHCIMIHRADGNASDQHRRALGFIYYSTRVKENAE
jgi:hypothetical protein